MDICNKVNFFLKLHQISRSVTVTEIMKHLKNDPFDKFFAFKLHVDYLSDTSKTMNMANYKDGLSSHAIVRNILIFILNKVHSRLIANQLIIAPKLSTNSIMHILRMKS